VTARSQKEEDLWLEAERRLAQTIDQVVEEWVLRGG
jgi:hypothetical protein